MYLESSTCSSTSRFTPLSALSEERFVRAVNAPAARALLSTFAVPFNFSVLIDLLADAVIAPRRSEDDSCDQSTTLELRSDDDQYGLKGMIE